jgi:hypothetical protein
MNIVIDMERPSAKHSLHSQSKRTPKQHKMLMERIVKIVRLFKPDDGSSFPEWFTKIRNR